MAVTAKDVKELRERTGAGMLDCKKALEEMGTIDKAIDYLREKGIAKAAKKAGRTAAQGLIFTLEAADAKTAVVLEFNSETDFVAKNPEFVEFGNALVAIVLEKGLSTIEELKAASFQDTTVEGHLTNLIAKIGENMNLRRLEVVKTEGFVTTYNHLGGKLGVIVEMSGEATEANVTKAKDIAMHVAAMDPKYLESSQVSTDDLDKEREIARKQLLEEGKPEAIVEKILIGKMNKFYEDNCLVNQIFVKAVAKETVAQYAGDIKVLSFKRYKVGEGIEVEVVDFAAEVAAQLNA
ncbi:MAG: elongation factor Ts [Fusobacteriaceae bacterium]|jgi:elongation factor Ts|nr:elongation factor Ts [Fusobacteriaceae bacterium]MBU9918760.1 translation elongation factor Ts [Fusobacteriaceae bacterium]